MLATSTWCLLELTKIVGCMVDRGAILPVFYEVVPSDVRHQRGSFAEAFEEHEEKLGEGNEEWRDALTQVASLAGWTSENYRYETELIKEIVLALWSKVHPSLTVFGSSEKLVGIETKLKEVDVLLDNKANDVRFIGIWGMGGLGKTTLARLVYEKISHQFDVSIFIANVREVSATHGLVHLQKQILSQILKEENVQIWDVYCGISMIKRCFGEIAVLLVLDDVDQSEQLEKLVGEKDCLGLRSRIIITTRDRHVLITHGVEKPYELKGLNKDEALQLFSWKAFKNYEPEEDYAEDCKSFVMYAGGLPLALNILGSFLYKRSPDSWRSALQKLQHTPNRTVFEILKISFDGLDEMEKKIFLDIACFRRLYDNAFMIELVYGSELAYNNHTSIAIDVLVDKSLLTISLYKEIGMHDLIRELGCEIVRQESYEEPGGRSRLWFRNDIFHVFTKNTGTKAIEGVLLHLDNLEEADWNLEAFSRMCKLKVLYIHNLRLSLGPKDLPNALRYLNWSWYPSKSLPPGFQPAELTELSLVHSNIDHLWNGIKYLPKLKTIDLSYSINLTRTPDLTGIPNLEKLVLEGCTNLVKIHPSIALLKRLKIWNFRNCKRIKSLPSEVNMEFLRTYDVSGCSKLKMIPKFVGQTKRLSKLYLGGTAIENLHSSIEHLRECLVDLDLSGSVTREQPYSLSLMQNFGVSSPRKSPHPLLPLLSSLKHFSYLRELKLNDCNLCEDDIPSDIGSLSSLWLLELRGNGFRNLPASIQLLLKLNSLDVENCKSLRQLPELPATTVLMVKTDNCPSLQVFPNPPDLCRLRFFQLTCISSSSMACYQDSSCFLYSLLKQWFEVGTPCSTSLQFVIPGSDIPEWFNNQCVGDSVIEKLPPYACNSKWIMVAVCALALAQDNQPSVPELNDLYVNQNDGDPDICQINCCWNRYDNCSVNVGCEVKHIVSDHLFLVILSNRSWKPHNCHVKDPCTEVTFVFKIFRAVGKNRRLKVTKCAARVLYEHDMEELISNMNQSKGSISVYEATDQQEVATVKATQEATARESRVSDEEYYSAEE